MHMHWPKINIRLGGEDTETVQSETRDAQTFASPDKRAMSSWLGSSSVAGFNCHRQELVLSYRAQVCWRQRACRSAGLS
jgi:hypothetical protein